MPRWQNQPPAPETAMPYRLLRVPAKGSLVGIATSTDMIGCNTHYARNRTIPCEGAGSCEACAEGYSFRWHCYVAILLTPGWEHTVLELTAAASDPLRNYIAIHNELRGCHLTAARPSSRPNGRVVLQAKPADLRGIRLPDPPDVHRILCHIWGVRYQADAETPRTLRGALEAVTKPASDDARYHATPTNEPGNGREKKTS